MVTQAKLPMQDQGPRQDAAASSRPSLARAARTSPRRRSAQAGFTLIELLIVMTIIGMLAAIAIPSYMKSITRAKEAVLREDLHTMRTAIDSYTVDKEQAPQSLEDVVQAGYLKAVPQDPMTSRTDTWITSQSDDMFDPNQTQGGISDVHSGSQGLSADGTTYNTW